MKNKTDEALDAASAELLPCPFCGHPARLDSPDSNTVYFNLDAECTNLVCGVHLPANMWNTRHLDAESQNDLKLQLAYESGYKAAESQGCRWKVSDEFEGDTWDTECGQMYAFIDGNIKENEHHFCPFCGGKISEPAGSEDK